MDTMGKHYAGPERWHADLVDITTETPVRDTSRESGYGQMAAPTVDDAAVGERAYLPGYQPVASRRAGVLVLDDDDSIAELLVELLEGTGYRVFRASNAVTALVIARREHPALVLTDCMMPGMSGLEFARRLRASAETRNIAIVMMSSARPDVESAGHLPFLAKPFDLDDVLAVVARYADTLEDGDLGY
jgi:CheY-like chemotaxis protein